MVAIEALIAALPAQPQNETLEDILARGAADLLTLTSRTDMLPRHSGRPRFEADGRGVGDMRTATEQAHDLAVD
jgi:hypothetical protein